MDNIYFVEEKITTQRLAAMAARGTHMVWKTWEQFIMEHELELVERKGRARIPCACRFCHAGKLLPLSAVEVHLNP
jgi:hypothetical protein